MSSSGPPDPTVFFTDRDLGKQFPEILAKAGITVRRHADHFPPDCPDDQWLAHVGEKGWVAITHDGRIRYKPNEKKAVLDNNVRLLVIVGRAPFAALAENFVASIAKCVFRSMPGRHSGACRAGVPVHAGLPFRSMPGRLKRVTRAIVAPFYRRGDGGGASEVTHAEDPGGLAPQV